MPQRRGRPAVPATALPRRADRARRGAAGRLRAGPRSGDPSGRISTPSNGSPRAIRRPGRSPGSSRRSGSTGWSPRRARSSRRRTSIPGCATTRPRSWTISSRRWSRLRPLAVSGGPGSVSARSRCPPVPPSWRSRSRWPPVAGTRVAPRRRRRPARASRSGWRSRPRSADRRDRSVTVRACRDGPPEPFDERLGGPSAGLGQQDPEAARADPDRAIGLACLGPDGLADDLGDAVVDAGRRPARAAR